MPTHFVTGGTGLVGRALIAQLVDDGEPVSALGRTPDALRALAAAGADPVHGDLSSSGSWQYDAGDADIVWHVGLPRARTPLRRPRAARDARAAWTAADNLISDRDADRPVILASSVLAWGSGPEGPVDPAIGPDPAGMGHWALAAEDALSPTSLRAVRLGWVYGSTGMFTELVYALRHRRYRIVGPGENLMPLVSADDAARALRIAATAPPGVYVAAEPDIPTQYEIIRHICSQLGVPRPDRLTPRMAAFGLGRAMVDALTASVDARSDALTGIGWVPRDDWREALVRLSVGRQPAA